MKTKPKKRTAKKVVKKSTALAKRQPEKKSLVRQISNPEDVLTFGSVLKNFIVKNQLSVKIDGNDYAMVSAWQFAGVSFGLTAITGKPEKQHEPGEYITTLYAERLMTNKKGQQYKKEVVILCANASHTAIIDSVRARNQVTREVTQQHFKYECTTEVRRASDNTLVSIGTAVCSNMERNKATFEEYAIASMAQTRSMGKAYRNLLGFVMKSAGYQDTPAEEMKVEEPFDAHEVVKQLPLINDFHFGQLKERLKKKDDDTLMAEARKHYSFTAEHEKEIDKILNSK